MATRVSNKTAPGRDSKPLAVIALERLRNDIIQCKLPPGSKITEGALCDLYGFSKAPVRTALFKLSQEGLVRTVPRHGYVIAPITIKSVQDLFELRLVLEPALARMAVGKIDIDELKNLNVAPGSSKAEQAEMKFLAANRQFHLAIARASGNQKMLALMTQLLDDMAKLLHLGLFSSDWRAGSMLDVHRDQAQQHEDLIDAFTRGDPDSAADATRLHVEESRDLVMRALLSQGSLTVGRVALA